MNLLRPICLFLVCLTIGSLVQCREKKAEKASESEHKHTNALIDETSPYLLQHAHNPVDWRAWGDEAFVDAKKENKLVLVSIGYSSCHWCHVMEEETFEDEEVAKVMNENFINIKVDREERPDVDQVYMTAAQLIGSDSGWPLNVITLPNGKPLYAGTYHTKEQWTQVLTKINDLYQKDPKKAEEYSNMVAEGIAEVNLIQPSENFELLNEDALTSSLNKWKQNWDTDWGGDLGREKFMVPVNLDFLLDYAVLSGDREAAEHLENTLDKILQGGIYDHLGGGFFRYSIDEKWKVPHFEKMLYDNAQAVDLYSKAYKVFKKPAYRNAVLETIDFLDREMKNAGGGYHAAIDADSEGEEGKFYVWEEDELKSILQGEFGLFADYFNVEPNEAWEEDKFVLNKSLPDKEFVEKHSISMSELEAAKASWRMKLMQARDQKVRPRSDDKVLTSWNALLIKGLVTSYQTFGKKEYLEKAAAIFDFLVKNSWKNEQLAHSFKEGSKRKEGFLEDYAFLVDAALALYGATMNTAYLEFAQHLNEIAVERFTDGVTGMFKFNQGEELIAKIIMTDDGVIPSPNAVMAHNLFRLGHLVYDVDMMDKSKKMLSSMIPAIEENASRYSKWNALLTNVAHPFYEIAVVGKKADPLLSDLQSRHIPNTLLVGSRTESELPLFKGRYSDDDTLVYVCQNTTCKLPVETVDEALQQLANF